MIARRTQPACNKTDQLSGIPRMALRAVVVNSDVLLRQVSGSLIDVMCLAIPGRIESIEGEEQIKRTGKINFGGILKRVSLAYVPEAKVGDYVIVHVGFALSIVDEEEAQKVFDDLRAMDELTAPETAEA